jgi:hypothetical protein
MRDILWDLSRTAVSATTTILEPIESLLCPSHNFQLLTASGKSNPHTLIATN